MARGKQSVHDVESDPTGQSGRSVPEIAETSPPVDTPATTPQSVPAVTDDNGKPRRRPDRSNPPSYVLIGENSKTKQWALLWQESTIGKAEKAIDQVLRFAPAEFDTVVLARLKLVRAVR